MRRARWTLSGVGLAGCVLVVLVMLTSGTHPSTQDPPCAGVDVRTAHTTVDAEVRDGAPVTTATPAQTDELASSAGAPGSTDSSEGVTAEVSGAVGQVGEDHRPDGGHHHHGTDQAASPLLVDLAAGRGRREVMTPPTEHRGTVRAGEGPQRPD